MPRWICHLLIFGTGLRSLAGAETDAPAAFFKAVADGNSAEVARHLDAGVSPNARDSEGTNALYLACEKEEPQVATILIDRGADVNLRPLKKGRSTSLQVSIYRGFDATKGIYHAGYPDLTEKLINHGADVNAEDVDGNTPLIAAAEKDDVQTMRLLLMHGADITRTNKNGWTVLDRAVAYRRSTIAHELVELGAPLDDEQQKLKKRYEFARKLSSWFPWILIGSFALAGLMNRRFKALPKPAATPEAGDDLPKLLPLKCGACGGSASLRPGEAKCASCHEPVPVPEDYIETLKLRARTFKLMEKAVTLWKRVRLVSVSPVRWALWIAAIGFVGIMWQGIFPRFTREALYDLMTFKGTMVWALSVLTMAAISIALAGYAIYLWEVRQTLPAPPAGNERLGADEEVKCPNCGGMVELKKGEVVGICGYCGSETYRVALAREARAAAGDEKHHAAQSLHQAMTRVYELRENAALAVPAAMIVIGVLLVAVLYVGLLFI